MKKSISQVMSERVLVLDGGMGSQILAFGPTVDDFGGPQLDGCPEMINVTKPQWIQSIHESYFKAGSDAVETNTFGCNDIVLSEFGIAHRTIELNEAAAKLARDVANSFNETKFVVGSVGPGTKILTLGHVDYLTMYNSYLNQMIGLLNGKVDSILIETAQDLAQMKLAVRAAREAFQKTGYKCPIWAQVTIETTGTMLVGTDIQAALTSLEMLNVDVLGINCATGPDEMRQHILHLSQNAPMPISCLPNAGLPQNVGGKAVYSLGPDDFAKKLEHMQAEFGLNIVGGCCGTTPDHIKALAPLVNTRSAPRRKKLTERSVASLYGSVSLDMDVKPLYVGERTNANGSKKFKDLLAANDYEGLTQIAKGQLKEGAHILDVCVAYVSRDEVHDMEEFLKRAITQVNIPLMIDSTEANVIERALQIAPGKCIVNSINFEDGEDKARKILTLCKTYGAAVVALTIDEDGMAKTVEKKCSIAKRLINLAVKDFNMDIGDVIIDPLTFTLGSGDEEFRKSAIATIEAIKEIKAQNPGVRTILGLSNVSFGLNPFARQMLNSMMLYHSVKSGLDMAILNASKIIPVAKIDTETRKVLDDLLYDNRSEGYDPLKELLAKYSDGKAKTAKTDITADMSIEERLKNDIIDGEKQRIVADSLEALQTFPPLDIVNNILLGGMKVVGERFGSGEMQLPFVLESAEAMKAAVRTLEPFMEKKAGYTKGRMILATVKGDVHDIGKNLVEIILSNNGYEVDNLGIKQPIDGILARYKETGADAIGLSGLLVKSTAIMKEDLTFLAEQNINVPVVLGGAALTRKFVEEDCQAIYKGPVLYAEDAFEGLRIMDTIATRKQKGLTIDAASLRKPIAGATSNQENSEENPVASNAASKIKIVHKGQSTVALTASGQSSWIKHDTKTQPAPTPPFWGTKVLEGTTDELFSYLDTFALVRSRWGFVQKNQSDDEFNAILKNKAEPMLEKWKAFFAAQPDLKPEAIYGYFPVQSEGNFLIVYDPHNQTRVLAKFDFPRQESGRRLCIADFYLPRESGLMDVMPLQVVTIGNRAADITAQLYKDQKYTDYFYFHGLCTELTEAYAEFLHARIRRELGIHAKDAKNMRQLFSQGYQGSRFSFGYPACIDLTGNEVIANLLDAKRIGVTLSESFQMVPELTTSALVSWHPQARYFSV